MTPPRALPGELVYVRTFSGQVMGPLLVESVEVTLNQSGRYDRFKFKIEPEKGYAGAYPVSEDRVFRTREAASA